MNETLAISDENSTEPEDVLQMVGFNLADEFFGVDILMVQEIIKRIPITAIPDSPDFIEGVINLRGKIIPIIDLRKRLNLAELSGAERSDTWIMILTIGERVAGFTVDRVTRVMKVPAGAIQPPPEMMVSALKTRYISGLCKLFDQAMAVLDFNQILVVEEFKRIAELRRQHSPG